jgi:hypothetical protein
VARISQLHVGQRLPRLERARRPAGQRMGRWRTATTETSQADSASSIPVARSKSQTGARGDPERSEETALSVGTPLKLPRCFKRILNRASIALVEVSDNHHVLDVPGRDAKGLRKLAQ